MPRLRHRYRARMRSAISGGCGDCPARPASAGTFDRFPHISCDVRHALTGMSLAHGTVLRRSAGENICSASPGYAAPRGSPTHLAMCRWMFGIDHAWHRRRIASHAPRWSCPETRRAREPRLPPRPRGPRERPSDGRSARVLRTTDLGQDIEAPYRFPDERIRLVPRVAGQNRADHALHLGRLVFVKHDVLQCT